MVKRTVKNYLQLRLELDDLLEQLQQPDCDIDTAVKLYERGLALAAGLRANLTQAENRVVKLAARSERI